MEQIINIHVEKLPEGVYLATSEDVLHYCQVVLEPTSPFTFMGQNECCRTNWGTSEIIRLTCQIST